MILTVEDHKRVCAQLRELQDKLVRVANEVEVTAIGNEQVKQAYATYAQDIRSAALSIRSIEDKLANG